MEAALEDWKVVKRRPKDVVDRRRDLLCPGSLIPAQYGEAYEAYEAVSARVSKPKACLSRARRGTPSRNVLDGSVLLVGGGVSVKADRQIRCWHADTTLYKQVRTYGSVLWYSTVALVSRCINL